MTRRILFVRSLPLDRDARSTKMIAEYRRRGYDVTAIVWSRGADSPPSPDTIVCTTPGGYGQRLRGALGRAKFLCFLVAQMVRRRRQYDAVHLVDFDTGIVGVPLARALGKPVIYDAFDHIGAIAGQGGLGRLLAAMERRAISASAISIFPDPIRLEQYGVPDRPQVSIIGNIPDAVINATDHHAGPIIGPLRLVYIGTLEGRHRGLEYIPTACEKFTEVQFLVGGTGELDDYFRRAACRLPNLSYVGHQSYDSALAIMADADALYGPYLLTTPAHRYASPNKMYEHLVLGKPLITNEGTPPGDLVAELGSGFIFDGTPEGLFAILANITREDCRYAGQRARSAWLKKFASARALQLDSFFCRFDEIVLTPVPK